MTCTGEDGPMAGMMTLLPGERSQMRRPAPVGDLRNVRRTRVSLRGRG